MRVRIVIFSMILALAGISLFSVSQFVLAQQPVTLTVRVDQPGAINVGELWMGEQSMFLRCQVLNVFQHRK